MSRHIITVLLISLFYIALRYVFISDSSFVNDEARLLRAALEANTRDIWASAGLLGSRGLTYSPIAVWLYQLLLLVSLNPITLLVIKITLDTVMLCASLCGLSRLTTTRGFPALLWIVPLSSPYFWFYARSLWDNTYVIALVSTSLLLYLSFLEKGGHLRLVGAVLCSALALSFHLMSLPWAIVLVFHALALAPGTTHQRVTARLPTMLLYSPVVWYYLFHQSRSAATLNVTIFGVEGALLGIRSMTGLGIEYLTGPWLDMRSGALVLVVRFLGVILGVPLLVSCVGAIWYFARVGILNELRSPRGAIFLTIILHGGLAFVAGLHTHPQYFNAIWIFFLFLVGFFVAQKSRRFDLLAVRAALVGNALTIVTILVLAHQNHGMRCIRYGSSIGEKWRIAGEINERSSLSSVVLPDDVAPFPHAFEIMAELDRLAYSRRSLEPSTPLTLRWRYPDAPIDCELMLVSSAFSVSESRLPHP